jgi:hypothetical protein
LHQIRDCFKGFLELRRLVGLSKISFLRASPFLECFKREFPLINKAIRYAGKRA